MRRGKEKRGEGIGESRGEKKGEERKWYYGGMFEML